MPEAGLAHEAVSLALSYTKNTVEWSKKNNGLVKKVIERVEGPVEATLASSAAKTVLKVGDRVLTTMDGTINTALNSSYYKAGDNFARTTYSKRIVPATTKVTTTVATTTAVVTKPVVNAYTGILTFADRQVDYYLPDEAGADKHLPLTAIGITTKATRRAVKRVNGARKWSAAKIGNMKEVAKKSLKFATDNAKPAAIRQNAAKLYQATFDVSDKLIDRYMPDQKDGLTAKGPTTLANKLARRSVKTGIAGVKDLAVALKNSPTTFKKTLTASITGAKAQLARIQNMSLRISYQSYDALTPYVAAAQTRSLALVQTTDALLMKYPVTAFWRNFAVQKYDGWVAPVVQRYLITGPKSSSSEVKKAAPAIAQEAKKEAVKQTPAPAPKVEVKPEPKPEPQPVPKEEVKAVVEEKIAAPVVQETVQEDDAQAEECQSPVPEPASESAQEEEPIARVSSSAEGEGDADEGSQSKKKKSKKKKGDAFC